MVSLLLTTFCLAVISTRIITAFARAYEIVDKPNLPRKKHTTPTPLLGGAGIIFAFLVVSGFCVISGRLEIPASYAIACVGATMMLGISGYQDDRYNLSSRKQLAAVIGAALWAVLWLNKEIVISNPFGGMLVLSLWVSGIVSFVWLVGMTMVTKILDGLDGLVTGISAIGGFGIAAFSLATPYFDKNIALLSALFGASCLGFLVWNYKPAQVFLGNIGSTWTGFMLALLALLGGIKFAAASLILALPSIDFLYVVLKRLKNGKKPWEGDDTHLHFRLRNYLGDEKTVWVYYGVALLMSAVTLILSSAQKYALLGVLLVLSLIMIVYVEKRVQKA